LDIAGQNKKELVHVYTQTNSSDLPAARKMDGVLACTSKWFMCDRLPCSGIIMSTLTSRLLELKERDPWRYLKYSFRARIAPARVKEEIADRRGIRYTPVHNLVGWLPGDTSVIDGMHAFYGTIVRHVCKNVLYNTGMIDTDSLKRMEAVYKKIVWPCSISRLPPTITKGAGSIKADQWRSHFAIFFVALFAGWEVDGVIPAGDADEPKDNTKEELAATDNITMDRSFQRHYDTVLKLSAALRIIACHSITPTEIRRGCRLMELGVRDMARMNCHLVPYFHLAAMHTEAQLLKYGPMASWWTFPYEQKNGFLGRFNHNGHSGGELEGTMMRGFWKGTMVQELVCFLPPFSVQCSIRQQIDHLESIESPSELDLQSIELLKSKIKGGTSERKGTLQHFISRAQAQIRTSPYSYFCSHRGI
ncbi:hypothetical protein C8F01DRAFT_986742, partial [Mycena amicta]